MALTDRDYSLTLRGAIDGNTDNPFENKFWFQSDDGTGDAIDLAEAFRDARLLLVANICSSQINFYQIEVINLVNLSDFATIAVNQDGTRLSNVQNYNSAWGFTYLRPIRGIHNGSKRFGPVALGDAVNQQPASDILSDLADLAVALETQLASGTDHNYDPCVVKTVKVPLSSNPAKFKYVPDTLYVCSSVFFAGLSHQDSRES